MCSRAKRRCYHERNNNLLKQVYGNPRSDNICGSETNVKWSWDAATATHGDGVCAVVCVWSRH